MTTRCGSEDEGLRPVPLTSQLHFPGFELPRLFEATRLLSSMPSVLRIRRRYSFITLCFAPA